MPFDPGRVHAILFDLDGTLVDTDDDYIRRAGELMPPAVTHDVAPLREVFGSATE